jgi:hypothetical protein
VGTAALVNPMKLVIATWKQADEALLGRCPHLLAALASASMLTGCVLFIPDVRDLRLVDVRAVEHGTANVKLLGKPAHDRPANYMIGRIDIVTQSDLVKIADASELTLWAQLKICQTEAKVFNYGISYEGVELFYVAINEETRARYLDHAAEHKPAEPYTYQVYFDPQSTLNQAKAPELGYPDLYEPYDFAQEPRDLCLRIRGGNILGGHFESNTVAVPSAALKRAFNGVPGSDSTGAE